LSKLPLKFVHSYRDRHGKFRHYFRRRRGSKLVPLPGLPGSAEFMAAYQTALAGNDPPPPPIGISRTKPGSAAAAMAAYLGSADFSTLAYATKRDRRLLLDRFREEHGEKNFAGLERKHVEGMLSAKSAKPYAAKNLLKALRAVVAVALRIGLRDDDPTVGIHVKTRKSDGWRTWTEADISQFENHWPIGSRERLAFALLLYTGQRRGDVIRLGRQHIRDGFIELRQGKTGTAVALPVLPDLAAILDATPCPQLTFLTTETGAPFSPGYFTNWFGRAVRAAGLPLGLSAHGLRKGMCRRLAELGRSANEIAAVSGHLTLKEVERYTKAADRKRMAAAALGTISEQQMANRPARLAKTVRNPLKVKERK
jgi:integrase